MSGSIYLAASGAILEQLKLETLANNVANINTPGFKEDQPIFRIQDNLESRLPNTPNINNSGRQPVSPYAPPYAVRTNFSSGTIKPTGSQLDMALSGDGFFVVQKEGKELYTRQGNFKLNEANLLVTQDGSPIMGQRGEITIDGSKVAVGVDGTLEVDGEIVDKIKIVSIENVDQLKKVGNTMFELEKGSEENVSQGANNTTVNQGFLELSNVNAIRAMTDMIEALRVTESYQKIILVADEATSKTISDVGRI